MEVAAVDPLCIRLGRAQPNFLLHVLMAFFFLAGSFLYFFFAFLMHFFSCTGLPVGAA